MSHRSLAALILLNAVLLAALVVTALSPQKARAQFGGGTQYMMIAGETSVGTDLSAVYILDRQSTRMIGAMYDSRNDNFEVIGQGRTISQDIQQGTQGRGRR